MPMMSIENVKKAEQLIKERGRIAAAKWDRLVEPAGDRVGFATYMNAIGADEQLQWAIEEFRARKLAEIDAQLRELGVDLTTEAA